jgi:DNA phosphorothioation-associated putative methyltransferase
MDPGDCLAELNKLVGKRVGGFLYVHRDAIDLIEPASAKRVAECSALVPELRWNVAKVSERDVSLLVYEDFDKAAFPALLKSAKVDLATGKITLIEYQGRDSPPILHRKETLLRPDDARIPKFSALTAEAEQLGLFQNTNSIGTKRKWDERLQKAGVRVVDHSLLNADDRLIDIARHRTAIARRDLSQPMQLMLRLNIIRREFSIFDYGCGQGDDVATLQANGYEAFGWDPHHAPNGPRHKADIVNLGFVLNVIENPHERVETLKAAWSFANRALTIAVMPAGKYQVSTLKPYKDGFLTSWGTFQRYFVQDDLRDLVASASGETPISLAPGIVAVFRDKELEQEVAYRRRSRASMLSEAFQAAPHQRPRKAATVAPSVKERIAPQLEGIWRVALDLGRLPSAPEVSPEVIEALAMARVSFERALALCMETFDPNTMKEATEARRDDLLVHFALTLIPGAQRYATLPRSIQRDVKTFFGSHATAMDRARGLLFSAGNPAKVREAIQEAIEHGLGGACNGAFRFISSVLSQMPTVIRVIVGCAEVIENEISAYDFLEIAPDEGIVRAIRCDEATRALPLIQEIVEVNLKALRRKRTLPKNMILYLKGRYLPLNDPARTGQQQIDEKMIRAGIVSLDGAGPDAKSLARMLRSSEGR